jgi:hypothetical protein
VLARGPSSAKYRRISKNSAHFERDFEIDCQLRECTRRRPNARPIGGLSICWQFDDDVGNLCGLRSPAIGVLSTRAALTQVIFSKIHRAAHPSPALSGTLAIRESPIFHKIPIHIEIWLSEINRTAFDGLPRDYGIDLQES